MFLCVTFSSYNSFLLCVFFPKKDWGLKQDFLIITYLHSSHFLFLRTQETSVRHFSLCLYSSQMWKCGCLLLLKKYLALLQAWAREENEQGSLEPSVLHATCFLWPLIPVPPFPLLYQHPYNYDIALWCLAGAFKCHYWCLLLSSLRTKEDLLSSQNSGSNQDGTHLRACSAGCIAREPSSQPPDPKAWVNEETGRATSVCVHP